MKHGPIALVDKQMPVIAIIPRDPWYDKMISQVEQVKARGGVVVVVATEGDEKTEELADYVMGSLPHPGSSLRSLQSFLCKCWRIISPPCEGWMLINPATWQNRSQLNRKLGLLETV